ncbi:RNA-directed DNA polymerase, eukaryota, reverse transcriptase zinc-binding domain protein [Tanacetum coccineum]|uniref:RNA-directed DNA polymerase, eukaryota, reverse transcriptase zinc-binding domain protein n=1 Tax=Tanacetum coccineum TaxID=301880 RepID=A0ABQ5DRJ0_9ASTR
MNRSLMFKWVWRFKSDNTSLWARFVKAMHGNDDLLGKSKIGNGLDTSFWEDSWNGDIAFKYLYPCIYALETYKKINVASKMAHENLGISLRRIPKSGVELEKFNDMTNSLVGFQLPSMIDRWFWSLSGLGVFSLASVRKFVDDHLLPKVYSKFCWRKIVPIKVIILAWKIKLDYLPTRFNLSRRGLDIHSILCPICEKHTETSGHTFFACSMASDIVCNIALWWDVNPPHITSFEEWELWMSSLNLSSNHKLLLEGVIYTAWWFIWNFRNKLVFGSTSPSKAVLFDDIVARSFQWCKHRGRFKFNWLDWLKTSYLVTM